MASDPNNRRGIYVNLNPEARRVVEQIREDTGVPNTEAMSRILNWFSGLDRKLRLAILNQETETRDRLLVEALQTLLANELMPPEREQKIALLRQLVEELIFAARAQANVIKSRTPKGG